MDILSHNRSAWDAMVAKRSRWTVPAGAVYFFEIVSKKGGGSILAEKGWLESVCDELQDRKDGYGLALWGVWEEKGIETNV